jgi:hypothetical protein
MNKPISVKAHLSIEELETRYRKAKDAVEPAPLADHLEAFTGQDDQSDCKGYRLLSYLDSHAGASLR